MSATGWFLHRAAEWARLRCVPTQKITGPENSEMTAFVVVDLDGAEGADGVVRCAKKILMDGARTMARSRTYSWALLGQQRSGASAGISVPPPNRAEGIAAFIEAVRGRVEAGELSLDAGKGVGVEDLAGLEAIDTRSPLRSDAHGPGTLAEVLTCTSVTTAAAVALDGLEGRTVAIEGAGTLGPVLVQVLADAGARIVAVGTASGTIADPAGLDPSTLAAAWSEHGDELPGSSGSELAADEVLRVEADALLCGSKLGLVDHDVAAALRVRVLAPIGVAPVTAKGLAVAGRGDVIVLPDFLTLSGALHAERAPTGATAESCLDAARTVTAEQTTAALADAEGPYLGACARAEAFLSTWQQELPFGRPLA